MCNVVLLFIFYIVSISASGFFYSAAVAAICLPAHSLCVTFENDSLIRRGNLALLHNVFVFGHK